MSRQRPTFVNCFRLVLTVQPTQLPVAIPTPAPIRPVTIPAFATPIRPIPTLPPVNYIPPVTTNRPAPPPPPAPVPVRPVPPPPPPPAPVTFAPPSFPPVTFPTPPVTFAPPVIVEPVRPLPVPIPEPIISEPSAVNPMALMPQLPTQQMPQIVSLDATCAKDSMVVRIRFDSIFNGLIYSKVKKKFIPPESD